MTKNRLYSPRYIREILDKYGFQFSKSLGQNFLIDGNIVRNIVKEAHITKDDYVLEIGPGIGTLTEELALKAKKVVAVELDKNLLPILDEVLSHLDNIEIIHDDILKVDINSLIEEKCEGRPIKIVANLPYYVTTPIIGKLLEDNLNIESIMVMIQKEVAERMVAKSGSKTYSSLSVFVNFYTNPEIVLQVPRTVFMPQPNVDSAVIKLDIKKELPNINIEQFLIVVKAGFSKRRKTILNSLSSYGFNLDKNQFRQYLEKANIDPQNRAENLTIEDFINISTILPPLHI